MLGVFSCYQAPLQCRSPPNFQKDLCKLCIPRRYSLPKPFVHFPLVSEDSWNSSPGSQRSCLSLLLLELSSPMTPAACSPLSSQHEHPSQLRFLSGCSLSLLPKVDLLLSFIHISAQILFNEKELFWHTYVILSSLHFCFMQLSHLLCLFTDLITVLWSLSTSLACIRL